MPPVLDSPPRVRVSASDRLTRLGILIGVMVTLLVLALMLGTIVIIRHFNPPPEPEAVYVPSQPPPPPPPPREAVSPPVSTAPAPSRVIQVDSIAPPAFELPNMDVTPTVSPVPQNVVNQTNIPKPQLPNTLSQARLSEVRKTENSWITDSSNLQAAIDDPSQIKADFPVYLASYADGDPTCNVDLSDDGKIIAGSLPNLVEKFRQWSHGNLKGQCIPDPLDIGSPELMARRPPFIFFTGHKDFHLTDDEITNLRNYLQVGGAIWGDNALAGRGSRFDVAFRREMRRVLPDKNTQFQPLPLDHPIYTKSFFNMTTVPPGMNYYAEDIEKIDLDGKLAIIYTPNDYSDMFTLRAVNNDTRVDDLFGSKLHGPLHTSELFYDRRGVFFRNYELASCLQCQRLGMNILGHLLIRFIPDLLFNP